MLEVGSWCEVGGGGGAAEGEEEEEGGEEEEGEGSLSRTCGFESLCARSSERRGNHGDFL